MTPQNLSNMEFGDHPRQIDHIRLNQDNLHQPQVGKCVVSSPSPNVISSPSWSNDYRFASHSFNFWFMRDRNLWGGLLGKGGLILAWTPYPTQAGFRWFEQLPVRPPAFRDPELREAAGARGFAEGPRVQEQGAVHRGPRAHLRSSSSRPVLEKGFDVGSGL